MSDRERNHVPELEHIVQHNEVPLHVIVAPIAGELPWFFAGHDCWRAAGSMSGAYYLNDRDARYAIKGWLAEKLREHDYRVEKMTHLNGGWYWASPDGLSTVEYPTCAHALVAAYLKMGAE